jgi:tRNA(Arg) A34 adenosine deaminase TadA
MTRPARQRGKPGSLVSRSLARAFGPNESVLLLQPCGMCSPASLWWRISRIVYGAGCKDGHGMYFDERHMDTVNFIADAYGGCAAAHASMSRRVLRSSAGIHRPLVERGASLHSHDGILQAGEESGAWTIY